MSHASQRAWAALLSLSALWFAAGGAWGQTGNPNPEIRFAERLQDMGYGALAVDHLTRTIERPWLSAEVRLEARLYLGRTLKQLGDEAARARNLDDKKANYQKAAAEFGRYLKDAEGKADNEILNDIHYERGVVCSTLGADDSMAMEGTAEQQERKDYRASATRWFEEAVKDLKASSEFYVKLRDELGTVIDTPEHKERFRAVRIKAGTVVMEYGSSLYEYARLFKDAPDKAKHDANLQEAIDKVFLPVTEHYSLFAVRYKAFRQIGQCYRELADFTRSVEYINKALEVQMLPETEWIIWLSRLNLAQTYNEWGKVDPTKFESADIAIDGLLGDLGPKMESGRDEPELRDLYIAAWLEKGKALVGHSQYLMKRADEARAANQLVLEKERREQAQREFQNALDKAQEYASYTDSRWSRNAKVLLDEWLLLSERVFGRRLIVTPNINTLMGTALHKMNEGDYAGAILAYEDAVGITKDPRPYWNNLIPECWYQIAVSYYQLSMPERTNNEYNYYYEAALCFDHIVEFHPKADFATEAAFYGQQLYGALFDQTRETLRNDPTNQYKKDALIHDGRRYARSLQVFAEKFPKDSRAWSVKFQAAEMFRTLEQYQDASDIYAVVMQEHPRYYEAKYYAGYCLYLEALKIYEPYRLRLEGKDEEDKKKAAAELPVSQIGALLAQAIERYKEYIAWFDNNKQRLGPDQLEEVNRWVLQTKLAYGKMLVHEAWAKTHDKAEGANQALQVLDHFQEQHLEGTYRTELRERFLPDAYFIIIQAYRRLGDLEKAAAFVDNLVAQFKADERSSQACRQLGYACLERRKELEEQKAPAADVKKAASMAGKYLKLGLELDPKQSLKVYVDTGATLYFMDEYDQAIQVIEKGMEGFPPDPAKGVTKDQKDSMSLLEDCYLKLERWENVERYAKQLLDIEATENKARAATGQPPAKNVDYRQDYGLAKQKLGKFREAVPLWREVKDIAKKLEDEVRANPDAAARLGMSLPEILETKFRATVQLARSYAGDGKPDDGYKVIAWVLLGAGEKGQKAESSGSWLRDKNRAKQVEDLFDECFSNRYSALGQSKPGELPPLGDIIKDLVGADKTLVQNETSKAVILNFVDKHIPGIKPDIEKAIQEATIQKGTSK